MAYVPALEPRGVHCNVASLRHCKRARLGSQEMSPDCQDNLQDPVSCRPCACHDVSTFFMWSGIHDVVVSFTNMNVT